MNMWILFDPFVLAVFCKPLLALEKKQNSDKMSGSYGSIKPIIRLMIISNMCI